MRVPKRNTVEHHWRRCVGTEMECRQEEYRIPGHDVRVLIVDNNLAMSRVGSWDSCQWLHDVPNVPRRCGGVGD